ncbi:MAG: hypothetical protein ACXWCV_04455 [Caldimonas sp.]
MGVKTESLGKTTDSGRIELTWVSTIGRTVKRIGLPGFDPKPDYAKLKAAMDKAKKPLEWEFTFDGAKSVFTVQADFGGTTVEIGKFDVLADKDRQKRRDALQKLHDNTDVVTGKDLEDFDKKFPPPPDPVKLKALKDEIERLKFEIERDKGFLKNWPKNFKSMDPGLAEIGFTNWAKGHRYDRYVTFLLWNDWGRDGQTIYDEFVKAGAPEALKLTDAAKKEAEDSVKAKKPKFDRAIKEVTTVVDTILIPLYRKEDGKAVENRIVENQKLLLKKANELKALLGR